MLKLQGITKEYPLTNTDKVLALKGIDLEFRRCEFVSILGQSGCGKTTLLNIIGGLDHYTEGDLFINGVSTKQYKDRDWDVYRNHSIGFIFQTYNLIMHLSVIENVELALTLSGVDRKERRIRAKEALKSVGLEGQENKRPNQLSGGQMQRVAIARALINDPEILLADEPTGALDSETSVQIMDILKEIAGQRLIIMVTHNPDLAYQYSTRIVKLKDGLVTDDSRPYNSETEPEGELKPQEAEEEATQEDASAENAPAQETEEAQPKKRKLIGWHKNKSSKGGKTSMNYKNALMLSGKNLWTKRTRTILTSVAGSIGIIGIAIVMALSSGFGAYVQTTAANALSRYPLTISSSEMDVGSLATIFMEANNKKGEGLQEYPDDAILGYNSILGSLLENLDVVFAKNDLPTLKVYLDEKFDPKWGTVKYNYNLTMHLYTDYASNDSTGNTYYKVNPYGARVLEQLDAVLGSSDQLKNMISGTGGFDEVMNSMDSYSALLAVWDEMTTDEDLLKSQYELVAGEWPDNPFELVFVVDKYNHIDDYMAFALGLANPNDAGKVIMSGIGTLLGGDAGATVDNPLDQTMAAQTVIDNLHYQLMLESDYYTYDAGQNAWVAIPYQHLADDQSAAIRSRVEPTLADGSPNPDYVAKQLSVSGVIRLKEGVGAGSINGAMAYSHKLIEWMAEAAKSCQLIQAQRSVKTTYKGQAGGGKVDKIEYALLTDDFYFDVSKPQPLDGNTKVVASEVYYYDGVWHEEPKLEHGPAYSEALYNCLKNGGTGVEVTRNFDSVLNNWRNPTKWSDYKLYSVLNGGVLADNLDFSKLVGDLGYANLDKPNSISIYSSDFDNKEKIIALLDDFKDYKVYDEYGDVVREGSDLQYSDMVGTMLSAITMIIQAITYVLIAFSSISLVVSSIMIGIITYTSVIERTKEIGVLRSIGARKKDITRVFNSETFIVGAMSGLFAVFVTWILTFPANAILMHFTAIKGLVVILWWHPLLLIGLSIFLTAVAGFIPSRMAARKDPVTALRTE